MDSGLNAVMKNISHALKLDSDSHYEEAYVKYLESIQSVVTGLLSILRHNGGAVVVNDNVKRYVKVGLQCMERVSAVLEHIGNEDTNDVSTSRLKKSIETDSQNSEHLPTPITTSESIYKSVVYQNTAGIQPGNERSRLFSDPVPPLPPPHASHLFVRPTELSPLDMAYKRNQQMLKAYKARLARMNAAKGKASTTTMSLTVQRKLAENLAIAKVKEESLAKKMKERQQRLEVEAARRFTMPVGLSKEEKEQRKVYKNILDYEHDVEWLQGWRHKIEANPRDPILVNQLIQEILRCLDHPLSKLVNEYQTKIYERIYPLIIKKIPMIEEVKVPLPRHLNPHRDTECGKGLVLKKTNEEGEISQSLDSHGCLTSLTQSQEYVDEVNNSASEETSSQSSSSTQSVPHHIPSATVSETLNSEVYASNDLDSKINPSVVSGIENSKLELRIAIEKGERVQKSLEQDNVKLNEITRDCEKYNMDSMDDLFDNSDTEEQAHSEDTQSLANLEKIMNRSEKNEKTDQNSEMLQDSKEEEEFQRMRSEAIARHLQTISVDVNNFLEKLIVMFTISYEQLNSPEGRDQCYAALEEAFFKPLWKYLLYMYRLANRPKEIALAYVMTKASNVHPRDMGIRDSLLCFSTNNSETGSNVPYKEVIDEIENLTHHYTLLSKLECVVKISKLICHCVEEFHQASHSDGSDRMPSIGADDLLPILTYVIIKSKCPQVVAECQAMLEFIHEGYLMGEEGYCLTSLQTAINYLVSMSDRW